MKLLVLAVLITLAGCNKQQYKVGDCITNGQLKAVILGVVNDTYKIVIADGFFGVEWTLKQQELERLVKKENLFRCEEDE